MKNETDQSERFKYEAIWTHTDYRLSSPGEKGVAFAVEQMGWTPPETIIDFGCGTGRASLALADLGFDVLGIDIAENALDQNVIDDGRIKFIRCSLLDFSLVENYAAGFCTDVMEHIPTAHVDQVLANISHGVFRTFFGIAHFPDAWHGETLHLTVEPAEWWADKLAEHFGQVTKLHGFNIRSADRNSYWRCENVAP